MPRRVLFVAVFLLPVLAALALLAAVAGRRTLTGVAAVLSGIVALTGAAVMLNLHGKHQAGPWLACPLALLALMSGARLIIGRNPS